MMNTIIRNTFRTAMSAAASAVVLTAAIVSLSACAGEPAKTIAYYKENPDVAKATADLCRSKNGGKQSDPVEAQNCQNAFRALRQIALEKPLDVLAQT